MRGLAFDGRCMTFEARADDFATGEGLGAVYMQPAIGAQGDAPALTALCGVAVNHDGRAATVKAGSYADGTELVLSVGG